MDVFWQIAPLGVLVLGVIVIVWRGLRKDPGRKNEHMDSGVESGD